MLKYKINVADALERAGFTMYTAKKTGLLSQDAIKKIRNEDTNISIKALNNICMILDLQPKDILIYKESPEDAENKSNFF